MTTPEWHVPAKGSSGGGMYTEWHEIDSTFDKKVVLRDQPRSLQLEYRVVSQNIAGENPSRAVDVVL